MMESVVGETKPNSFADHSHRSIIVDYLLAASTHGLRSVGRAYSFANRLFWIILLSLAFGFMLYFVISSTRQYFTYPTKTNVEIHFDDEMVFPAVTICNANPFRLDKMNASLVSYFYQKYSLNTSYNQSELISMGRSLIIDLFNQNKTEEIFSLGFQLNDMLLECSYNSIDCSQSFISSLSSIRGNCYTFNWKKTEGAKLYTLTDFGTGSFLQEGLSLTLYLPNELNFPTTTFYDIGLMLLLHDNNELPVMNKNPMGLQPGMSHLINYEKSETTFLPSPYTQCTSEISPDLYTLYQTTFADSTASMYTAYSESVCRDLCIQAYIFSQCSCIQPIPFFVRYVLTLNGTLVSGNSCKPSSKEVLCAWKAKKQFVSSKQLKELWCSHCASQCTHTAFTNELSSQSGPTDMQRVYWSEILLNANNTTIQLPNDFVQRFDYYFDRNYLKVFITCGNKYVTVYKQEAQLTITDTFAAIGGQMGL